MFYPDELIEEIRERNDIVDVVSSYVKLQKKGANHMGLCPFHNEKSPSFSVNQPKQMYHCFGCGVGGNVYTFLMEYENYTFVEAVKLLAERAGVTLPEREYDEAAKKQADLKSRLLEINKEAAKYYYVKLKSERGQPAKEYLLDRGLSEETIQNFGLGYSAKTGNELYRYLKEKGYGDELLKQAGLFTFDEAKGVFDKFWNRVMFPIMDANNRVIGFGGRVMGEGAPKYLNSPETKIFDKSRNLYGLNRAKLSREKYMLVCEGYMDVIALHQAGFTNAAASLGTAFTGLQANLLKRYTDEVLLTYDSDGAGTKAALRAIPILKEAGLSTRVINMKPYKDPDEFIKGLGADAFRERIIQAQNSFYFEIEVLEQDYDMDDPEAKTRFFQEVAKKLLVFQEDLERNNYIEAVAGRYFISAEHLRKLVNRYGAGYVKEARTETRESYGGKKGRKNTAEEGLRQSQRIMLTWLVNEPGLFERLKGILGAEDFMEPFYREVASMLFEQYARDRAVNPAGIINHFESKEEQSEAASLFHSMIEKEMDTKEREKALNETVRRIKKLSLDAASVKASQTGDVAAFGRIIREQAGLQNLHISLKDG